MYEEKVVVVNNGPDMGSPQAEAGFFSRHPKFLRRVLACEVGLLAAFGADMAVGEISHVYAESHIEAPQVAPVDPYDALPAGHCWPADKLADRQKQALACLAEQHGTIDLVNFGGLSPTVAQSVADESTKLLKQASGGIVDAKYKVVDANTETIATLNDEVAGLGCILSSDHSKFVSAKAAENMPSTASAALVQALVPYKDCGSSAGASDIGSTNRLSDVYLPSIIKSDDYLKKDASRNIANKLAPTIVHEALHSYGLEHFGSLDFKLPPDRNLPGSDVVAGVGYVRKYDTSNVSQHLRYGYNYQEYSDQAVESTTSNKSTNNVMGTVNLPELPGQQVGPTLIQRNRLLWPKAALEGKENLLETSISSKPTKLNKKEVDTGQYFNLKLDKPLTLHQDGSATTGSFDELDIVPQYRPKNSVLPQQYKAGFIGANVFLSNSTSQSAYMGPMFVNRLTNDFKLTIGDQSIEVRPSGERDIVASVGQAKPQMTNMLELRPSMISQKMK